jgi:5-methyltetrahydrofolate--homocysteine methyltransferase
MVSSFRQRQAKLVPYGEACAKKFQIDWSSCQKRTPAFLGSKTIRELDLATLRDYIDWSPFFMAWELKGKYPAIFKDAVVGAEASRLFADAQAQLEEIISKRLIRARAIYGFWPAASEGDDVQLYADEERQSPVARFHFLRQQWVRPGQDDFRSLADYIAPADSGFSDYLGAFVITAGIGADELAHQFQAKHDDYNAILVKALADRFAEAGAEWLHEQARKDWGYGQAESLSKEDLVEERYEGIRPAPGYPACPDHTEKRILFDLLQAETEADVHLTESFAMMPAASVSGFYFSHPQARYFAVDRITRWLAPNLGYEPG